MRSQLEEDEAYAMHLLERSEEVRCTFFIWVCLFYLCLIIFAITNH